MKLYKKAMAYSTDMDHATDSDVLREAAEILDRIPVEKQVFGLTVNRHQGYVGTNLRWLARHLEQSKVIVDPK